MMNRGACVDDWEQRALAETWGDSEQACKGERQTEGRGREASRRPSKHIGLVGKGLEFGLVHKSDHTRERLGGKCVVCQG